MEAQTSAVNIIKYKFGGFDVFKSEAQKKNEVPWAKLQTARRQDNCNNADTIPRSWDLKNRSTLLVWITMNITVLSVHLPKALSFRYDVLNQRFVSLIALSNKVIIFY